jgi:hypothetical protein
MEVIAPPFPQDIEDDQVTNEYQQMNLAAKALPHILQQLK